MFLFILCLFTHCTWLSLTEIPKPCRARGAASILLICTENQHHFKCVCLLCDKTLQGRPYSRVFCWIFTIAEIKTSKHESTMRHDVSPQTLLARISYLLPRQSSKLYVLLMSDNREESACLPIPNLHYSLPVLPVFWSLPFSRLEICLKGAGHATSEKEQLGAPCVMGHHPWLPTRAAHSCGTKGFPP